VFEFTGALILGRVSTNTIAGGIADIGAFAENPEVYALWNGVRLDGRHDLAGAVVLHGIEHLGDSHHQ
jgi:hypothetical protein